MPGTWGSAPGAASATTPAGRPAGRGPRPGTPWRTRRAAGTARPGRPARRAAATLRTRHPARAAPAALTAGVRGQRCCPRRDTSWSMLHLTGGPVGRELVAHAQLEGDLGL